MTTANLIPIALADDHAMMRAGLAKLINSFGPFKVIIQANNGLDLLKQLNAADQLPEICIVDVNMPELNGYDTVKRLKLEFPQIKILALSMYDAAYSAIEMIRNGASGFLNKTDPPQNLKKRLLQIIAQSDKKQKAVHPIVLSERELEFLKLCAQDLFYKEMAVEMKIGVNTVHRYRENLFIKLGLNSRIALAIFAYENGLLNTQE